MTTKTLSKNQVMAKEFVDKCKEYGFTYSISDSVLKVFKTISANSNQDFSEAEAQSYSLLACVPQTKAGSVWGTDGGSIGGLSAIQSGSFHMYKSGCSARVLNAIKKL